MYKVEDKQNFNDCLGGNSLHLKDVFIFDVSTLETNCLVLFLCVQKVWFPISVLAKYLFYV